MRALVALPVEADERQQLLGPLAPLAPTEAGELQRQLDVAPAAVSHGSSADSWNMNDGRAVRRSTSPVGRLLQPGDEVEQRRLAAARGAQQADELAGRERCRSMSRSAVTALGAGAEGLADPAQLSAGGASCTGRCFTVAVIVGHPCALSRPAASTAGLPACVSTLFSAVTSMNPLRLVSLLRDPRGDAVLRQLRERGGERVEA